jgi:hypothetical protein
VVGPGASKEDVLNAYGWPSGQSKSGTKEILSYPQGTVTLDNDRVEKVAFSMNTPWPAPRPRPAGPTNSTAKKAPGADGNVDFWVTHFDEAAREASRRNARILALFSGTDWSPACKQFNDEVALHPDFINAFTGDYVFLRLEFMARTAQPPELREHANQLRDRYSVTTYPTVLIIAPSGNLLAQVDLSKPQPGANYRERVIAAVRAARDTLAGRIAGAESVADRPAGAVPETPGARPEAKAWLAGIFSAKRLVFWSILAGVGIAAVMFWLVWRNWATTARARPRFAMAARISDAADGLPSEAQLLAWPRDRVAKLIAALAESDGYRAEVIIPAGDKDVLLRRGGEDKPAVAVYCLAGPSGGVTMKRMREFYGTLTIEGIETGWYVAPAGFGPEARAFAAQNKIVLIDTERLMAQLRDLPPLIVPKILAKVGVSAPVSHG